MKQRRATYLAAALVLAACGGGDTTDADVASTGANTGSDGGASSGSSGGNGKPGMGDAGRELDGEASSGSSGSDGGGTPPDAQAGCAASCSGHGTCVGQVCQCSPGYGGEACDACAAGFVRASDGSTCVSAACAAVAAPCDPYARECSAGQQRVCQGGADGCWSWSARTGCGAAGCESTTTCASGNGVRADQWGTPGEDAVYAIVGAPDGKATVAGRTAGPLDGQPYAGNNNMDMYLSVRNVDPKENVTRQWGTSDDEFGYGIALLEGGGPAVAGYSYGKLGTTQPGFGDAVLTFLDDSYTVGRTIQWGSGARDRVEGMARGADGSLWVVGYTDGNIAGSSGQGVMFATRFDSAGNAQWTRQWGGAEEGAAIRVAVDETNNAYVVGGTEGVLDGPMNLGGSDVTCTKLSPQGEVAWIRQWGSGQNDYARDVAVTPNGRVVVAGWTRSAIAGAVKTGTGAMFLTQLDADGKIDWTRTFGAGPNDIAAALATTPDGSIYVAGYTFGALVPNAQVGKNDAFLSKRNAQGEEVWTKQVGTSEGDFVYTMSVATDGTIYVAGGTAGSFPGFVNQGSADNFVLTFAP